MANAVYGEALQGFTATEQELLLAMLTRVTQNLSEISDPILGPTPTVSRE